MTPSIIGEKKVIKEEKSKKQSLTLCAGTISIWWENQRKRGKNKDFSCLTRGSNEREKNKKSGKKLYAIA